MRDQRVWYHVILTTYGAWLYGDRRGFRTRHHREHVEGDYKHPPPAGTYDELEKKVRASMQHEEVFLAPAWRERLGRALMERFEKLGRMGIAIAVSAQHVHVLVKMFYTTRWEWVGAVKRHAWFELHRGGWNEKLWGKKGKLIPVRTRGQQLNVYRYIANHRRQGAWVWVWTDRQK